MTRSPTDDELAPWEEALALCEEIRELLPDLSDRADDFATSVEEKVDSIAEWIADNEHVTDPQWTALENMKAGCERWLEHNDEWE
jgi:hypothetical protein